MKFIKATLLAATAFAGAAQAATPTQVALPAAVLHGAGATSIQVLTPQQFNCIGLAVDTLGITSITGTQPNTDTTPSSPLFSGNSGLVQSNPVTTPATYPKSFKPTPACAYTGAPAFTAGSIQPATGAEYVGTGSGFGRKIWDGASSFDTLAAKATGGTYNPFYEFDTTTVPNGGTKGVWSDVQFAFSDSGIGSSEVTAYNTNKAATDGAAIEIPLYVLPVALAYNPVYGHNVTTGTDLKFNVKSTFVTKDAAGNPTGGLHLSTAAYCAIVNGAITNWNNPNLAILNGGVFSRGVVTGGSLQDANDSAARWNADGAPIRLVGRLDNSGTTDIFTRAIAAQCNGQTILAGSPLVSTPVTNKYTVHAQALPFDNTSAIDLRPFLAATKYYTGDPSTDFAGTVQSLSGAVYVSGALATTKPDGSAALPEVAGLFAVSNGSTGVSQAVVAAPDAASASDSNTLLNGKLAYIGADFVKPASGATLFSAALQTYSANGKASGYVGPSAANALAAFGTVLPPETSVSGAYVAETRVNSATGLTYSRGVARDWYDVLYNTTGSANLAAPVKGYAITGSTQLLTYTCFASDANRYALAEFLGLNLTQVKAIAGGSSSSLDSGVFTNTAASATKSLGVIANDGISPLPTSSWQKAVAATFLSSKPYNGVAANTLYIQSALPTTSFTGITSNPSCTANTGA